MKKIILCLLSIFLFTSVQAQIFPIYDTENEIYGYLTFKDVEKVNRKEHRYLMTLLDINLNKVSQSSFVDAKKISVGKPYYNGNSIFFEVIDIKKKDGYSFRVFDVENNKISSRNIVPQLDKKTFVASNFPIDHTGYGLIIRNLKTQVNEYYAVSNENKKLYKTYPFGNPERKKSIENSIVIASNSKLLITKNNKYERKNSKDFVSTLLLVDISNGETLKELNINDDENKVEFSNVQILENKIVAFGDTYKAKTDLTSNKTSGMFRVIFDLNGNLMEKKIVEWKDFQGKLDIKEGGFVKKNGFIYTHDYVLDEKTGHTIVVGEYVKGRPTSVAVKDLVFLDFDQNFNLNQVFEVEKKASVLQLNGFKIGGSRGFINTLIAYNYFDYKFHNNLDQKNGLSFFYFNVEKVSLFSGVDYAHGIVTFKDGEFKLNKIEEQMSFWTKNGKIVSLLPSKPGYFLLTTLNKEEEFDHRLERIDY